jgi:hypothetical protein
MLSLERIKEMRQAELGIARQLLGNDNVKRIAQDYADALGELIDFREALAESEKMPELTPTGTEAATDLSNDLWDRYGKFLFSLSQRGVQL